MYDELTGLPNIRSLKQISNSMIAIATRKQSHGAVLFVDIDGFKPVNDELGHQAGDDILRQIASRLQSCLRRCDVVARVGGDEFVIQLADVKNKTGAETVALNAIDAVSMPFDCNGVAAKVGASVGIAIYPDDGDDVDTLIGKADHAMYAAKKSGKNVYRVYKG